jgi:IS605 OrfB family transposase
LLTEQTECASVVFVSGSDRILVTLYFWIGKRVTILLPIFFYHNSAESLPSLGLGRVVTPSGENQTIAVEDLALKNMIKNQKLALSISDASWGEWIRQLEYKCDWYGRTLVKIDRWSPSSKRCGNCGNIVEKLPLNIREWDCPKCGTHHDRDVNAAKNILAAFSCGECLWSDCKTSTE